MEDIMAGGAATEKSSAERGIEAEVVKNQAELVDFYFVFFC